VRKLVVLHQGAIGDFVLALSVVQAVRSHLGVENATAIATAPSAKLAAGRSAIDVHHLPDQAGLHTLFREAGPLDDRLASLLSDADCVLSFLGGPAGTVHERLCGSTAGRVLSVDPRPSPETITHRRHITAQWHTAIREAGLDIGDPQPPVIRLGTECEAASGRRWGAGCEAASGQRQPAGRGRPRIIIHPGSGGRAQCWPVARFVELVESMPPVDVTWMLGPAESGSDERFTLLHQRAGGDESLVVERDLLEAAGHMASSDLYVGNDAGTTHLAAAMGVPAIAIFAPTDPRLWRPLGNHVIVVAPARRCDPITTVTTPQVGAAVRQALKRSAGERLGSELHSFDGAGRLDA